MFEGDLFPFLQVIDQRGEAIDHLRGDELKSFLRIPRMVLSGAGQFAHQNDELLLDAEDLARELKVFIPSASEAERDI